MYEKYFQALLDEGCNTRMGLKKAMITWTVYWHDTFKNIFWSGEAVFRMGGFVDYYIFSTKQEQIPVLLLSKMQIFFKVTV